MVEKSIIHDERTELENQLKNLLQNKSVPEVIKILVLSEIKKGERTFTVLVTSDQLDQTGLDAMKTAGQLPSEYHGKIIQYKQVHSEQREKKNVGFDWDSLGLTPPDR